jgi:hypothetical protein
MRVDPLLAGQIAPKGITDTIEHLHVLTKYYYEHTERYFNHNHKSFGTAVPQFNNEWHVTAGVTHGTLSIPDVDIIDSIRHRSLRITPGSTPTTIEYPNGVTAGVNHIQHDNSEYIFLDCGRWINDARDFGVIWGKHVYLCSYQQKIDKGNNQGTLVTSAMLAGKTGLDVDLFNAFISNYNANEASGGKQPCGFGMISVCDWVTAHGADNEFDWDQIHIIIPDLHLMNKYNGDIWHSADGYDFVLKPEVALYNFSLDLTHIDSLKGKTKVIQLGDVYDLWVGHGFVDYLLETDKSKEIKPLYIVNYTEQIAIDTAHDRYKVNDAPAGPLKPSYPNTRVDPYAYLKWAIQDIQGSTGWPASMRENGWRNQGWFTEQLYNSYHKDNDIVSKSATGNNATTLNPAETALRILEKTFGNDMTYIWGNHDCYLADPKVQRDSSLKARVFCYESPHKSIFIEHGQRLEFIFQEDGRIVRNARDQLIEFAARYILGSLAGSAVELVASRIDIETSLMDAYKRGDIPTNEDGAYGGFQITCQLYNELRSSGASALTKVKKPAADQFAKFHDQAIYKNEFARFKIGRESTGNKSPKICVIGHTHMPTLQKVVIELDTLYTYN